MTTSGIATQINENGDENQWNGNHGDEANDLMSLGPCAELPVCYERICAMVVLSSHKK